jgi:hypothetical protein
MAELSGGCGSGGVAVACACGAGVSRLAVSHEVAANAATLKVAISNTVFMRALEVGVKRFRTGDAAG